MKKFLITILLLSLCTIAYSADFSTITDDSIKVLLNLLPQYKTILNKMGDNYSPDNPIPMADQYSNEILDLFKKYNISMKEFSTFMQKVSMGYATMQMQKSEIGSQMGGFMKGLMSQMDKTVTNEELAVLKKYETELQKTFESE